MYRPLVDRETQVAVVGAGAAGLYTALRAAREGASVTLVSATPLAESSSWWAQGGLAAALSADDNPALHLADTIAAGRRAVRTSAARVLCEEAPGAVEDLARLGMSFDAGHDGRLGLGLEGGHSARRIVHAGGAETGKRLVGHLSALVSQDARIEVLERRRAIAILGQEQRCDGLALDDGSTIASAAVVLATGGAAALWSRSTNPPGAVGAGLLLAHTAGAALADLELTQFHPTAVMIENGADGADGLLVTEAVRGEGALLVDCGGQRFVDELAPRDVVARAVQRRMALTGARSVGLDMREVDLTLFPSVVSALRAAGIDPEREVVPVAPAAHYMMGGIAVDLGGRTTLPGLFAVGECSCTGLHGANRLASNSLSECFVFGARAARAACAASRVLPDEAAHPGEGAGALDAVPGIPARSVQPPAHRDAVGPGHNQRTGCQRPSASSRRALWRHAGLERDRDGLLTLTEDPHPLVRLIGTCALARLESRGAHLRRDFPNRDPELDGRHITIRAGASPVLESWA